MKDYLLLPGNRTHKKERVKNRWHSHAEGRKQRKYTAVSKWLLKDCSYMSAKFKRPLQQMNASDRDVPGQTGACSENPAVSLWVCDSKACLLGTAVCCSIFSVLCLLATFVNDPLLRDVCAQMETPPCDFRHKPVLPKGNLVRKDKFLLPLGSGGCEYGLPSKNLHAAWQWACCALWTRPKLALTPPEKAWLTSPQHHRPFCLSHAYTCSGYFIFIASIHQISLNLTTELINTSIKKSQNRNIHSGLQELCRSFYGLLGQ